MDDQPLADYARPPFRTSHVRGAPPVRITSKLQVPGHYEIVPGFGIACRTADGEPVPFVHGPGQLPIDPIAAGLAVPFNPADFPDKGEADEIEGEHAQTEPAGEAAGNPLPAEKAAADAPADA